MNWKDNVKGPDYDGFVDDLTLIQFITGYGSRRQISYDELKKQFADHLDKNLQRLLASGKVVVIADQKGNRFYRPSLQ